MNLDIVREKLDKSWLLFVLPNKIKTVPFPDIPEWEIQEEVEDEDTGAVTIVDTGRFHTPESMSAVMGWHVESYTVCWWWILHTKI